MSLAYTSRSTMRKTVPSSAVQTNDFHQVRLSELRRNHAITELSAAPDQVPVSYFVPTLQSICADLLAKNFRAMNEIDVLKVDHPKLFDMIVDRVSTSEEDVPLSVSVARITDEGYWKRACESRWSLGQISKYADERLVAKVDGWKQLYLERALCDYLLSLRSGFGQGRGGPSELRSLRGVGVHLHDEDEESIDVWISDAEVTELAQSCHICKDFVHRIDLPCQYSHLKLFEHLFSKLPSVFELRLSYGASNAGVGFHRRMIGFTDDDARSVTELLTRYSALQCLRIPSNRLTTQHVQSMCSALVGNTTLRVLDLSSNMLKDEAIQTVSIIISQADFLLEELYLHNNNIRGPGALALAHAMSMNKSLRVLHLQQNRIPDEEGGPEFIRSLVDHPSLTELHIGSNCLGHNSVEALHEVLPQITLLTTLNLSGNSHIGTEAIDIMNFTDTDTSSTFSPKQVPSSSPLMSSARLLMDAIEMNKSLQRIDVRMCNLKEEEVHAVESVVYNRVRQLDRAEVAQKEAEMKEMIRIRVEEKTNFTRGPNNPL